MQRSRFRSSFSITKMCIDSRREEYTTHYQWSREDCSNIEGMFRCFNVFLISIRSCSSIKCSYSRRCHHWILSNFGIVCMYVCITYAFLANFLRQHPAFKVYNFVLSKINSVSHHIVALNIMHNTIDKCFERRPKLRCSMSPNKCHHC